MRENVLKHYEETDSMVSKNIIENFDVEVNNFLQVCPKEMLDKLKNPITKKSVVIKIRTFGDATLKCFINTF